MNIIKRDGSVVKFNKEKIIKAISKAMMECNEFDLLLAQSIANDIECNLNDKYTEIEQIQDLIESQLMNAGLTHTAKKYILYRENRKQIRDIKAGLYEDSQKRIKEIIELKNIDNSNANVDESSFSGRNNKVQSHFLKEYALNNLVDDKVALAHREGRLYVHDLDNYCSGMSNCINVDFHDLFENNKGFVTRNGDVRKPNDIMTFFQLVAVVFQAQSQNQFGKSR